MKKADKNRPLTSNGADNGARTRDPNLGKVVLYQLSHVRLRIITIRKSERTGKGVFDIFQNLITGRLFPQSCAVRSTSFVGLRKIIWIDVWEGQAAMELQ